MSACDDLNCEHCKDHQKLCNTYSRILGYVSAALVGIGIISVCFALGFYWGVVK